MYSQHATKCGSAPLEGPSHLHPFYRFLARFPCHFCLHPHRLGMKEHALSRKPSNTFGHGQSLLFAIIRRDGVISPACRDDDNRHIVVRPSNGAGTKVNIAPVWEGNNAGQSKRQRDCGQFACFHDFSLRRALRPTSIAEPDPIIVQAGCRTSTPQSVDADSQFAIMRSGTLLNSLSLFVTRVASTLRA